MDDLAIRAEGLGKQYLLGETRHHTTLKEAIGRLAKAPLAKLRRASDVEGAEEDDSDRIWALRDACFEIHTGEVVGLVGRNGAGKSTLLKLLARIIAPTEGRAEIYGRVGSLLEVGTGFHPELTGRENVFLNGAILGLSRSELRRKFDEIVSFAGVERFIDTPVKRYSSGMYTRLAFGVAAHIEPEILMIDEVLSVGDAAFQRKCLDKMRDAASEGRTVLLVSHNLATLHALAGRCLLLEGGRIVMDGSPARVVATYLDTAGSAQQHRDLTATPRPLVVPKHRPWEFTGVRIETPAAEIGHQPLRISLSYRCRESVEGLRIRLAICHPNGTNLVSSRSLDDGREFRFEAGASGRVRVEMAAPKLMPGIYVLSLTANLGGRQEVDQLPDAIQFEALPGAQPSAGGTGVEQRGGSLGLHLPARWETD